MGKITEPQPLEALHDRSSFDCGEPVLNDWLKRHALKNEDHGTSRTYVVCDRDRVIGYYVLAAGAVTREEAHSKVSRNSPEPVPVFVLGRLAVDVEWQKKGLGQDLLRDAVLRAVNAAETIAAKVLLVHAINDTAKAFYLKNGFLESPIQPMTLMLPLH